MSNALILVCFALSGWMCFWFGTLQGKSIKKIEVYHEALNIFYRWRNEIGGVSLKGVGQHYEKWIMEKINQFSNPPPHRTDLDSKRITVKETGKKR